jgi:hypothetical protein
MGVDRIVEERTAEVRCAYSIMVMRQPSKLLMSVRF